jgi:integrase/recombinase XerD
MNVAKCQSKRASESLGEAVEKYLVFLQLERGAGKSTVSSYQNDLRQFIEFLSSKKIDEVSDINFSHISGYVAALSSRELRAASVSRKITSLRTFFRFLHNEKLIAEDFTERISSPKLRRKLPHTLTLSQFEKLLAATPENTPQGIRDRAILELLFSSGLRVSELCGLKLTDFDDNFEFVRVMGKGSKERVVPVGKKAAAALRRYIEVAREKLVTPKTDSSLFLSRRGVPLSRLMIWLTLKNTATRAGISPTLVKPHGLRHTFATELLKGGADLRLIQGLLGHSSIATTQIYTAVEPSHLIKTHEDFHPRKGMKV